LKGISVHKATVCTMLSWLIIFMFFFYVKFWCPTRN